MKTKQLVIFISMMAFSSMASAVDGMAFCKKMQSCMLEEMKRENMPASSLEAMKPMIDGMCSAMSKKFEEIPPEKAAEAEVCMKAMLSASCDDLMNKPNSIPGCARMK